MAHARYIAVSGYGTQEDRNSALAAGFDEYLVKPVDIDKLLGLLTPASGPASTAALATL
jgi:two-component system, sensor histidine kinase